MRPHTVARAIRRPSSTHARKPRGVELSLLGGFELVCDGRSVELSVGAQRLVALLALQDAPLLRSHVAGMLWLEGTEEQVAGNLRSTLWRLHAAGYPLVD